jgi:hypothetical protein
MSRHERRDQIRAWDDLASEFFDGGNGIAGELSSVDGQ